VGNAITAADINAIVMRFMKLSLGLFVWHMPLWTSGTV
jgi:hypothetical protein